MLKINEPSSKIEQLHWKHVLGSNRSTHAFLCSLILIYMIGVSCCYHLQLYGEEISDAALMLLVSPTQSVLVPLCKLW